MGDVQRPPAITLRHRLHEDLTSCAWRPFCFSTLAVCSAKNGVILWHKLGRHDVKSVATITSIHDRNKTEKLVPSCNAQLVWSPPSWFKKPYSKSSSVESSCSIAWSSNGEKLGVLWYGTVFLMSPGEYTEINHGFDSTPIAKIDGLSSPFSFNYSENTSLFYASTNQGQSVI